MYQQTERTRRVGELLRREIADILQKDMDRSDFRLVSLTAVTVSRDLRNATVFFTLIGKDEDSGDIAGELSHAKGFIRRQLGTRIRLKRLPDLVFRFDDSIGKGFKLSKLIDSVADHEPKQ